MVKICIESEEVTMSGDIGITAKFRIITKAKLDSIRKYSSSKRPQVVRMVRLESTGQGLVRTRLSPKILDRKSIFGIVNMEKCCRKLWMRWTRRKKWNSWFCFCCWWLRTGSFSVLPKSCTILKAQTIGSNQCSYPCRSGNPESVFHTPKRRLACSWKDR